MGYSDNWEIWDIDVGLWQVAAALLNGLRISRSASAWLFQAHNIRYYSLHAMRLVLSRPQRSAAPRNSPAFKFDALNLTASANQAKSAGVLCSWLPPAPNGIGIHY